MSAGLIVVHDCRIDLVVKDTFFKNSMVFYFDAYVDVLFVTFGSLEVINFLTFSKH